MEKIDGPITEYRASTAEEFWEIISPQKYLFGPQDKPIFRGHADATWKLEPLVLRDTNHPIYSSPRFRSSAEQSDNRIFAEIYALHTFARYCDSAGLRIPGDSEEFRRTHLNPTKVMDSFILHREIWPSNKYFEIMALAQHFGLPTRLLDWTYRSYVAEYFAASNVLLGRGKKEEDDRLAVWALNTGNAHRFKNIELIRNRPARLSITHK